MRSEHAVPILLYHSVRDDPPSWIAPYTIDPTMFGRHLDRILASGRVPIGPDRLAEALHGGRDLPRESVLITFDDGYADFARYALPQLVERGLPATLYVTTDALSPTTRPPLPPAAMLTWRGLRSIADAPGLSIGAHGCTHRELDTLPIEAMHREITDSRQRLEDELDRAITSFAYPYGYNNGAVREAVRNAGYTTAMAVRDAHSSRADDPWRISRLMVRADTGVERLDGWLAGDGPRVAPFRDRPQTFGWRAWRQTRARLRGHRLLGDPEPIATRAG
ncbi:polysaccharide deacetylase family protein [Embleya sp. NBC_00896]|uniref:polysaccharide deacetylase family protein n=1 Tax=Embleya sp. NBC_00896 TaxID=2975961 RepID=UPI00386F8C73|nr:polysaccharide deacetylase family protein [Embleya sp. NBC_00896]